MVGLLVTQIEGLNFVEALFLSSVRIWLVGPRTSVTSLAELVDARSVTNVHSPTWHETTTLVGPRTSVTALANLGDALSVTNARGPTCERTAAVPESL